MPKLFCLIYLFFILPVSGYCKQRILINGYAPLFKNGNKVSINRKTPPQFYKTAVPVVTSIKGHRFSVRLSQSSCEFYSLTINGHYMTLCLQPGKVQININDTALKVVNVSGNLANEEYLKYRGGLLNDTLFTAYLSFRSEYFAYKRAHPDMDSVTLNKNEEKLDRLLTISNEAAAKVCLKWTKEHPYSYINPMILYDQLTHLPEVELKTAFNNIPAAAKSNIWAEKIKFYIDSLTVGAMAPVIVQNDMNGAPVALKSLRGKYVLIDFWASWCVACRAGNPQLVKTWEKYHKNKFDILSSSLDDDKQAWVNAVKTDGLTWVNVSDLKGRENSASLSYYVGAIPENYLINPEGRIVAKNVKGEELTLLLDKLLR